MHMFAQSSFYLISKVFVVIRVICQENICRINGSDNTIRMSVFIALIQGSIMTLHWNRFSSFVCISVGL